MADERNLLILNYEIDLTGATPEKLEEYKSDLLRKITEQLMATAAGARGGGVCEHSKHDRDSYHCKG